METRWGRDEKMSSGHHGVALRLQPGAHRGGGGGVGSSHGVNLHIGSRGDDDSADHAKQSKRAAENLHDENLDEE